MAHEKTCAKNQMKYVNFLLPLISTYWNDLELKSDISLWKNAPASSTTLVIRNHYSHYCRASFLLVYTSPYLDCFWISFWVTYSITKISNTLFWTSNFRQVWDGAENAEFFQSWVFFFFNKPCLATQFRCQYSFTKEQSAK